MMNVRVLSFSLFFLLSLIFSHAAIAQVGINTETPDASAALDVVSADKGLLIPRVDTSAISNPATGLMVFRPADNGFYFYNGSRWQLLGSVVQPTIADADGDTKIQVEKNPDEDIIRMDLKGQEKITINSEAIGRTRIEFPNNQDNIAFGKNSLTSNTTGIHNIAFGLSNLRLNEEGSNNFASGYHALYNNTNGSNSIAIGNFSLIGNNLGNNNIALGYQSLYTNRDGNDNVALGHNSLFNFKASNNVAIGNHTMYGVPIQSTGGNNIAIGDSALYSNTTGEDNIANGFQSLYQNTSGFRNIANGYQSLYSNTTGEDNIANGYRSLYSNTTGIDNIANGFHSLYSNTTGNNNVAIGLFSLEKNTAGNKNTSLGAFSLRVNTAGSGNVALGYNAGRNETGSNKLYIENTDAGPNTALIYGEFDNDFIRLNGRVVLRDGWSDGDGDTGIQVEKNPDEDIIRMDLKGQEKITINSEAVGQTRIEFPNNQENIAIGRNALNANTTAIDNVAIGAFVLEKNTQGTGNTGIGKNALKSNTTGVDNVALGNDALGTNSSGSGNVGIGFNAGKNETGSNKLYIENTDADLTEALIYGDFTENEVRVNNFFGINNVETGIPFSVKGFYPSNDLLRIRASNDLIRMRLDNQGNLFIQGQLYPSDRRLKKDISPLSSSLTGLLTLGGYHYYWKDADRSPALQTGLIAQEVQEVFPELVSENHSHLSLNYTGLIPHLVEGMKEQQAMITSLKSEIAVLKEMMMQLSAETSEE